MASTNIEEDDESVDGLADEDGIDNIYNPYLLFDGEFDEDLEDIRIIFRHRRDNRRAVKFWHERKIWHEHVDMLLYTNQFEQRFRMEKWQFDVLLSALEECITVSYKHSMSSTGGNDPIYPEIVLACGLRFCNGTDPEELADIYGMSVSSAKRVTNIFLNAIDYNDSFAEMQINLPDPTNRAELDDLAARWEDVSTVYGLFTRHLGAIDGWLPRTTMPRGVTNQTDYFSGHYQCYGLNIQAMCDPDLLFLYIAVAAPGKTNDLRALSRLGGLRQWFDLLPDGYYCSGDNAYPLCRKLLIPFGGAEAKLPWNRVYNFYLCQLRIRIEMAFGRLTTKWRRLRTTLSYSIEKNAQIIRVCAKLHNFVIRMEQREGRGRGERIFSDIIDPSEYGIDALKEHGPMGFIPTSTEDDFAFSIFETDSSLRNAIVAECTSRALRRPQHNVDRNA